MVIKNVNLETVCGITSSSAKEYNNRRSHLRENQM